jgi:hypothetical protein
MSTTVLERLSQQIQEARTEAHTVCATQGATSGACAVAWDIVEELQAEASHRRVKMAKNSLEAYCEEFPDAFEARVYDM